jgi:hypothetical protein
MTDSFTIDKQGNFKTKIGPCTTCAVWSKLHITDITNQGFCKVHINELYKKGLIKFVNKTN